MALLLLALFPAPAAAATYDVRFCAEWDISFEDATSGYDDYYTDNSTDMPARGARMKVVRVSDGYVMYDGYTDDSGSLAGCTDLLTLDESKKYDVHVTSKTYVNGNYVKVWDDESTPSSFAATPWNDWRPSASETSTRPVLNANWVNIVAAGSVTVFRHNGGVTGATYNIYDEGSSGCADASPGGSRTCNTKPWITAAHADNKYVISHEVGHQMQYLVDGSQTANFDYDDDDTDGVETTECQSTQSHNMVSAEYASAAALEGVAHFIAATTFNKTSESDCWFRYYKNVDWDGDTVSDGIYWTDCELDDHCDNSGESCGPIGSGDHFGSECNSSTTDNRGVEYDYLRGFWDLRTDEDVAFPDCMDIWDTSDPNDWNENDAGSSSDDPAERLRDAADTCGFLSEWDAVDNYNGMHR